MPDSGHDYNLGPIASLRWSSVSKLAGSPNSAFKVSVATMHAGRLGKLKLSTFSPEPGSQSASNYDSDDAYPHGNVDTVY
jgi:hypothetical protein